MKKWVELNINAFMNIAVALIAGGILKLVLDTKSVLSSVLIIIFGLYFLFAIILSARK